MPTLQRLARHRATRIIAVGTAIKLAIGIVAYALLADMHQLATAALCSPHFEKGFPNGCL